MRNVLCVVCRRRPPETGYVCDADQKRMAERVIGLVSKLRALEFHLVPGQNDGGERVSTSRVDSPAPLRMDVLSLTGPGSSYVEGILRPLRRHWKTERVASVSTVVSTGQLRVEERTLTEWHTELVRDENGVVVAVADDDQVGALPPKEWLDSWVRTWRRHFGHAVPPRTMRPGADTLTRTQAEQEMLTADPRQSPAVAAMVEQWRRYAARTVLGLETHDRSADPLADEWEIRFGEAPRDQALYADVHYLLTWLSAACADNVGIAEFAAELGALTSDLARALGETSDDMWLGRCPATISETIPDPDDPTIAHIVTRPCGAGLWHDPTGRYAKQVMCPRCHSTWGPNPVELLYLKKEIRRVWPIDRQHRYTASEINDLDKSGRLPHCQGCLEQVSVTWREITTRGDNGRFWRPVEVKCPNGCQEARRVL